MILHITQHDLDTANYLDIRDCACARALKREFPKSNVIVDGYGFTINGEYYVMPYKAADELVKVPGSRKAFWMRIPGLELLGV